MKVLSLKGRVIYILYFGVLLWAQRQGYQCPQLYSLFPGWIQLNWTCYGSLRICCQQPQKKPFFKSRALALSLCWDTFRVSPEDTAWSNTDWNANALNCDSLLSLSKRTSTVFGTEDNNTTQEREREKVCYYSLLGSSEESPTSHV